MRLLQLDDNGTVSITKDKPDATTRYAILSHTWGGDNEEVTFEGIQNLSADDKRNKILAKVGYNKILFCGRQAKQCGIDFFWVDTCCIDKSSSAELQEAINSMFSWYRAADRCFVYLSDVSHGDSADSLPLSRWFTRGWTLQELLAPKNIDFYSKECLHLGSKVDLESQLTQITGIPAAALKGNHLSQFSVQERLAWAGHRSTKRPEDKAYSLLGIFEVYIPMIYGPDCQDYSLTFDIDSAETEHFVGREFELNQIHSLFRPSVGRRTGIIHGLGGMGKTQLAIAYAKRYRDNYSAIHWFNARDDAALRQSFMRLARRLQARDRYSRVREGKGQTIDDAIRDIGKWLSEENNTRWLMIFDNLDTPRHRGSKSDTSTVDIAKYLPEAQQGCVLITTRSPYIKPGRYIYVKKMTAENEALEVLSRTSEREDIAKDPDALALVQKMDGLPLALATAGAYLCQTAMSCADYLRLYNGRWLELLETTPELDSYEDRTLYSTWNITYNIIEQRNKLSAYLVRFWAYLNKGDVWFELLKQDIPESPDWFRQLGDELCFNQAMRVLSQFGLIEPNSWVPEPIEAGGYSMHSCVHAWATHVLNAKREDALATLAVQCIASHVPNRDALFWWITQGRLRLHAAKFSCSEIEKLETGNGSMVAAMYRLGNLALDQDELDSAAVLLERTLALQQISLGEDNPATLNTMNMVGALRRRQERYNEAEEVYTRILSFPSSDKDTVVAAIRLHVIYNFGCLHLYKDQPEEAKRFFQQALEEHKRERDACENMTLFELGVLDNMGTVHRKLARLDQSIALYRDAVRGKERLLGRQHVSTLDSTYNLALALFWRQDFKECLELLWRVYLGRSKTLGPRHRETLRTFRVYEDAVLFQRSPDEAAKITDMPKRGAAITQIYCSGFSSTQSFSGLLSPPSDCVLES